jgi:hypothetical protein
MKFRQNYLREVVAHIEHPKRSHVYFILAEADGFDPLIKIGISIDVDRRFNEILKDIEKTGVYPDYLEAGICDSLTVLGSIEGTQVLETALHRTFKDKLLKNEWFSYDHEMEIIVEDLLDKYCQCPKCNFIDKQFRIIDTRSEQDLC